MMLKELEKELVELPRAERLRIARWLLDTVLEDESVAQIKAQNPLLNIAGRFDGGPGDSAERIEEILSAEVDPQHGLGKR